MSSRAKGAIRAGSRRPNRIPPGRARPSRRGLAMGAIVALLVGFATWGTTFLATSQSAPSPSGVQRAAARIRAEDAARNKTQVRELTALSRNVADKLDAVLRGLDTALPASAAPQVTVDAARARRWSASTQAAVQRFDNPPSGDTGTNIARQSLLAGAQQLDIAVRTYGLASEFTGRQRLPLLASAREQRDVAVRTWSVGATALDVANVGVGYGHQHVYLQPSSQTSGALTSDGSPQGSSH